MRRTLTVIWVLLPVVVVAWHYGPGQAQIARDRAGEHLRAARAAATEGDFERATAFYAEAAKLLPPEDQTDRNRIRLAQACSHVRAGEMIEGQDQLEQLLADLENDDRGDEVLEVSVRHELATASYHAAWLMRLEGATVEEWKPEAERARQQFRLLGERAAQAGDSSVEASKKNLEATIRLEQMDLSTLKSLPPPKNCPPCKNLSQRKRKQCQSRCQGQGKKKGGEQQQDVRQQIRQDRGAGLNRREGTGS